MPISSSDRRAQARAEWRSLAVALVLLAGVVAFVASCGSGDLIFPGMAVLTGTPTAAFTNTPASTSTPTNTMVAA